MKKPDAIKPPPTDENVREWLAAQMQTNSLETLLAFADDGVIWGSRDGKSLTIAHDLDKDYPDLIGKTLQQAFAFNSEMEIRLFRDEMNNWQAWKIMDDGEIIKESQILWGDKLDDAKNQPQNPVFKRLLAERKGIPSQLIPVNGTFGKDHCIRLEVHHMVDFTAAGEAYITLSRLAGVSIGKKNEEV